MSLNVVVVDDSAVMRALVSKALRVSGLSLGTVYEAASAEDGLRVLDEHEVHLALVDINMPGMSGVEMVDYLRCDPEKASLPIVVVSSDRNQRRIERLESNGAAVVGKPFTPELLRESIEAVMGEIK